MKQARTKSNPNSDQSFAERCYRLLKTVPPGKVTTYKDLARALGSSAYRAVGTAMAKNPYAPGVPCHRVVKSDGSIGQFQQGPTVKAKMLRAEGLHIQDGKVQNFDRARYRF